MHTQPQKSDRTTQNYSTETRVQVCQALPSPMAHSQYPSMYELTPLLLVAPALGVVHINEISPFLSHFSN